MPAELACSRAVGGLAESRNQVVAERVTEPRRRVDSAGRLRTPDEGGRHAGPILDEVDEAGLEPEGKLELMVVDVLVEAAEPGHHDGPLAVRSASITDPTPRA